MNDCDIRKVLKNELLDKYANDSDTMIIKHKYIRSLTLFQVESDSTRTPRPYKIQIKLKANSKVLPIVRYRSPYWIRTDIV